VGIPMKYAGTLLLLLLASPALAEGVDVTASGGFLCEALVNGVPISSHSQYHKAQQAATNAELANPAGETEIRCNNAWRVEKKEGLVPVPGACVAGETIPAGDGCNVCLCVGGLLSCSSALCPSPDPTPEPVALEPAGTPQFKEVADGVKVSWTLSPNAASHSVSCGDNVDGTPCEFVPGTSTPTSVIVKFKSDGWFCVTATSMDGESVNSCNAYSPPAAPPPPELKANLTWNASPGATGYRLFTGTVPGFGGGAGIDLGNVTSYTATGFTAGTTHYFRVSAYNNTGESKHSNEVSKTF